VSAPDGGGQTPAPSWYDDYARERFLRELDSLFRAVLPDRWVQPAIDAALSEASPLVTPQAHTAAIKKETDWQHHWLTKWQAADIEAGKLRRAIDLAAVDRARAVLRLVADARPSRTAKHDGDCHTRHAACLAAMVRAALLGPDGD
jgi:hypothetical protein